MKDFPLCAATTSPKKPVSNCFGVQLPTDWQSGLSSKHIYPTQWAPIVCRPPTHPEYDSGAEAVSERVIVLARSGLLPSFAKDEKYGLRTHNARSETVATLASFNETWAKARHCIIPASSIYEPDTAGVRWG